MVSLIWLFLIGSGIIYSFFTGNMAFINNEILNSAEEAINLVLTMIPVLLLWMGVMNIADKSGLLDLFAKLLSPFLSKLFTSLKKDSKALGYVASNIACNVLGLGSVATPFGLKAMQEMQKENPKKDEASEAMITFLVLNTAGVTIIPTTVIALRNSYGSISSTAIIIPSIIGTAISSIAGLTLAYIIRSRKQ